MENDVLISRAAAIDAIVSLTVFPDAEYIKNLCQNPSNSEDWLLGMCDAINAVEDVSAVDGWISVKDRLPDEKENWITKDYQKVICCCDFGGDPRRIDVRTYGFGNGHFWHGPQIMDGVITHWMPLPEPPKEDNDAER